MTLQPGPMLRIGLIADTHGLLRPEAVDALRGSDVILHAGDIGAASILDALRELAPLVAIRGNNDTADWASTLRDVEHIEQAGVRITMVHDIKTFDTATLPAGTRVVVSGHSHKPSIETRGGALYVNPGSAGRRRFTLPISVGELLIDGDQLKPRIIELA